MHPWDLDARSGIWDDDPDDWDPDTTEPIGSADRAEQEATAPLD